MKVKKEIIQPKNTEKCLICPIHKQKYVYLFLNTQSQEKCPLKCPKCVTQEQLDTYHLLSLEEIMESKKYTILDNWPLHNKNFYFVELNEFSSNVFEKIAKFFKQFRFSVIEQIDEIEDQVVSQYRILEEQKNRSLLLYEILSEKQTLQKSLNSLHIDFEQGIKNVKECILSVNQDKQKQIDDIEYLHKYNSYHYSKLSLESFDHLQQQIKGVLDHMQQSVTYQIDECLQFHDGNLKIVHAKCASSNNSTDILNQIQNSNPQSHSPDQSQYQKTTKPYLRLLNK